MGNFRENSSYGFFLKQLEAIKGIAGDYINFSEMNLFALASGKKDTKAVNALLYKNARLIIDTAFKFSRKYKAISLDDFIGAGYDAFLYSLRKHNPEKGAVVPKNWTI
jgi:hypothetical protein